MYRKDRSRGQLVLLDRDWLIEGFTTENDGLHGLRYEDMMIEVMGLHDMYRIPFMMMLIGYKYREIGEELCLCVGTVKGRIYRARGFLKLRIKN